MNALGVDPLKFRSESESVRVTDVGMKQSTPSTFGPVVIVRATDASMGKSPIAPISCPVLRKPLCRTIFSASPQPLNHLARQYIPESN